MKNEITAQPYLKEMTYDEDCWLIIDCRSGDSPYVSYYNPKQDKDKEFETFKDFAQSYFENEFQKFDDSKIEYKENEKTASASGCSAVEDEDYDEESRRSWKTMNADAQMIEVMSGIKLEDIPTEVKKVDKNLSEMESDIVESAKDAAEERRDPYAYRGLSKRDFI